MARITAPILLLLLLSGPVRMAAQKKGYEPGYLVSLNGDTLRGWVKDRSPGPFEELYSRIRFRPGGRGRTQKYSAEAVRGYASGSRVYESVPLREESSFFRLRYYVDPGAEKGFLQVVRRQGPLTWYHREFVHDDNHYVDFVPLFHREGAPEMVRVTQGVFGLKRERLMEYFEDCPELVGAVANRDLNGIEEVYHFYLNRCLQAVPGSADPEGNRSSPWSGARE